MARRQVRCCAANDGTGRPLAALPSVVIRRTRAASIARVHPCRGAVVVSAHAVNSNAPPTFEASGVRCR